ncbi:SusC/RagA family TonB-linked outer membrane protein [Lacibacter sp.]|uniref:SusC/RagA family TonB-linked outer membrane protein n=1 Tax=Lacibacter sp. TaxID=1915409 RepID=UPI002B4AF8C0|nr:SusC/RagA family TonB-linked outer membrane protein [Lacibacter sp.]HLP37609.1 SusC/RagA family TonB-linked outer membrane protein [Lacibacter sp.]
MIALPVYVRKGSCLLISLLFFLTAFSQQKTLSGKIITGNGKPVNGASVTVKGTSLGTVSDASGNFSISLSATAKSLLVSAIGFADQEIDIAGLTTITVTLSEASKNLNEVVVIGYGTQKRKDITGSITTIGKSEFNKGVVTGVTSLIQGKVPGLVVSRQGGDPNAAASVLLRGPSTLTGSTAPFYVIDGVPGADISTVNPEDIMSIDVMKDATSTAIYGTRAANGVIMVTTRRAKSGQQILSYSAFVSTDNIIKKIPVATADELRAYLKTRNLNLAASDEDNVSTDWQDVISRNGVSQNHSLSFGGGNQQSRFLFSMGLLDQKGVIKKSGATRYTGRLTLDHSMFNNKLRFSGNLAASFRKSSTINYDALQQATQYLPTAKVYNTDGTFKENYSRQGYKNPLALIEQNDFENKYTALTNNGVISWDIFKGLTFTASGTYEKRFFSDYNYSDRLSYDNRGSSGYARRSSTEGSSKILETYLNYEKNFDKHSLKLLAGYSWQGDRFNDGISIQTTGFLTDDQGYYGIANSNPLQTGFSYFANGFPRLSESNLISFYGRVNYTFNSKYILQAILRRDGSSRFGANEKWAMFPAVSAAWRISGEEFMKKVSFISDLKLRAGYGVSGNANVNPYQSFVRYNTNLIAYVNGIWQSAYGLAQIENPDLKWEKTATSNIGLDFGLIDNKITGTVEYYIKTTTDMIFNYLLPSPPFPVGNVSGNGGKMQNKGVEVLVNYQVIDKNNVSWNTGLNFAANKNEILTLQSSNKNLQALPLLYRDVGSLGGRGLTGFFAQRQVPGYSLGTFYLFRYAGQDAQGNYLYYDSSGKNTVRQSALKPQDQAIINNATALPKFTLGWINTVSYKQFSLNFLLRGSFGNKIYNGMEMDRDRAVEATVYNPSSSAIKNGNRDAITYSTLYLESGDYVRLDNATLYYKLPDSKVYKNAQVYITANNLFTITKFTGVDPEVKLDGQEPGLVGLGGFSSVRPVYFQIRSFTIGVNFNF